MNKLVLVTGGSGFVGKAVIRELKSQYIPFYYSYTNHMPEGIEDFGLNIDLLDETTFYKYRGQLEKVTDLMHVAAYVPARHAVKMEMEEFEATVVKPLAMVKNLFEYLPNIERVVVVSSCYVELDDPKINYYGLGKKFVEEAVHRYAKLHAIDSIVVRFPQIFGPGETHGMYINKFAELFCKGEPITLDENASCEKDVIYIKDVTAYLIKSLSLVGNHTTVVSSQKSCSPKMVAEILQEKYGAHIHKPSSFKQKIAPVHFTSTYNNDEFKVQYSLESGLEKTVEYYKTNCGE